MRNKRKPAEIIKLCRKIFTKWSWIVEKWGWRYDVHYVDKFSDMPAGTEANVVMRIYPDWGYLFAAIYVCLELCDDLTDDEIEADIIHELTHMLIAPMANEQNNGMNEYTTETISRIIFMTYKKAKSEKKPEEVVK